MPSVGSGSDSACPNASNKTLHETSQPCSQQAKKKPAAIRGSRTTQQQASSSSNTDSKQQASSSRRPGGREQAAKTATMGGRSEHRYYALLQFLLPSVEETARRSQSSKPPPAASVLSLQVCQAACQTKRRSENLRNTSQTGPPIPICVKLAHRHSVVIHLRSGVAEPSDSDRQPRTTSQVACNNSQNLQREGNLAAGRLRVPARGASLAGCGRPHLTPGKNTVGAREKTRERSPDFE